MSHAADRLSSWNDGPAKSEIMSFVERASLEDSPDFVRPADRIAAFDNDGTLWVEQPMPPQAPFLLEKLAERVQADPALAEAEPYRSIIARDPEFLGGLARQEPEAVTTFLSGVGAAFEGMTPEAYDAEVREFVDNERSALGALKAPATTSPPRSLPSSCSSQLASVTEAAVSVVRGSSARELMPCM